MARTGGSDAVLDASSRRAFLQSTAGAAAGAAAFMVIPKAASIALESHGATTETKPVVTKRSGPAPAEPVTAYVHNADRHEVVVMWGQRETTYKDPALVKRLLDAAR
jgi:hypothetical protein